jgi:hypothetical protein
LENQQMKNVMVAVRHPAALSDEDFERLKQEYIKHGRGQKQKPLYDRTCDHFDMGMHLDVEIAPPFKGTVIGHVTRCIGCGMYVFMYEGEGHVLSHGTSEP